MGAPDSAADSAADSDSPAAPDSAVDTDSADTGRGRRVHTTITPPVCGILPADDWAWTGSCPQMTVHVAIAVVDCALTIDYRPSGMMTMGMPFTGTITETTVIFADGDTVTGCVGAIEGPNRVTGGCDGGCTFDLDRRAPGGS